ncbi:MAG TPA: SusC/RagA family TonB-linked outer membrane protein [Cyclobacteriaceae bacterium]|jgi:TonB-linked SusC/RagA family outer membrane protein
MKRRLLIFLAILYGISWSYEGFSQERTVSGKVTSGEDGSSLPGVNILLKGTSTGTITDVDGAYRMTISGDNPVLIFSYVGYVNMEVEVGTRSIVEVTMESDVTELSEIVVTALGVSRETKTLPYASQQVTQENLNITQDIDIRGALSGKIAGVQLNGQAGSKLGQFGKIRVRGAISLTKDEDPLFIVDGVPTPDPNDIDMNNIESINVLKGPNATALYGQRAEFGVIVITTKKGHEAEGLLVDYQMSTTWDKIGYLPKYQNLYGGGYEGEASWATFDYGAGAFSAFPSAWSVFDGKRYITYDNNYADESWGPKFDGQDYVPWYAWWPDSPYYGQTAKYEAQPDNVKDFYETGVTAKNTISLSGSGSGYAARVSYSNVEQSGITPFTHYNKDFLLVNTEFDPVNKLKISAGIRYSSSKTKGDFGDGYGNQTSGSFNSWFNRQLETDKLRELKDLKTFDGYSTSWNWWGPEYYTLGGGYKKAAFWFNPYTFMEQYKQTRVNENFAGNFNVAYKIIEDLEVSIGAGRNASEYKLDWYFPFFLANSSAPELYNSWSNSFGKYRRAVSENNYHADLRYNKKFDVFDLAVLVGGNIRRDSYRNLSAQMPVGAKTGGLIIPDVYTFSNAGLNVVPSYFEYKKQVNSFYGNLSAGYNGIIYIDASYRRDFSSALTESKNGYGYPAIGTSFIFSELLGGFNALTFGKLRASWAQVGSDVDALALSPIYNIGAEPFVSNNTSFILMSNPTQLVDPNIKPSLNTSFEVGFDTRFIQNRMGLSFTYYDETRKDEIIPVNIPRTSGYNTYLTNAGESRRSGVEISLDADVIEMSNGITWNILFNFAKNKTTVESLPGDLEAINGVGGTGTFGFISVINELGNNWGQLRGTAIERDANGNAIIQPSGLYKTIPDQYFGSILPDFTGGFINRISYKGVELIASIDYQKGGKFFSLSEQWGAYSGLTEETAALNDLGMNVRDDVGDGGGVRVVGVDANGNPVDMYVDGLSYYTQWYSNRLAEPFVHDASYIKLREVGIMFDVSKFINTGFIKAASLGFVARNVALLSVAKDNVHRWDPSILSTNYGENGQLPGTRSYGINLQITF